jgi:hypothetical protein
LYRTGSRTSAAGSVHRLEAALCAVLFISLVISLSSIRPVSAETLGSWNSTNPWKNAYLQGITGESCATYSGYIYCVGGFLVGGPRDEVYYAPISSSGVGTWVQTTSYPTGFWEGSCAISSGYIYCVGGDVDSNGDFTSAVYYASVSSSGVGTWTSTTAYPVIIAAESCAISSGYIYCIAGTSDESYPQLPGNVVAYAPISSSGVGTWQTSDYPNVVYGDSCAISSGYIYCVGGDSIPTHEVIPFPSPIVYYASVSSSGVGTWTSTTNYPTDILYASCNTYDGFIYCVGGQTDNGGDFADSVYYAPVSSTGVGTWSSTSNYPQDIYAESCAISSGYIYCVGGQTTGSFIAASVNYASISASSTTTSSSSTSSTTSSTTTSSSSTSSTTSSTTTSSSSAGGLATCTPVTSLPAGTSAQDTCTGTPSAGDLTAVSTNTGITVTITGTSATGSVTITPSDESGAPSSGADLNLGTGTTYYDVKVSGAVDGTAQICISPTAATMQYYDSTSSSWVSASNIVVTGTQICGDIPVSALTGTPIATGTPTVPIAGVPEFPPAYGLAATAIGILALAVFLKMRAPRKLVPV